MTATGEGTPSARHRVAVARDEGRLLARLAPVRVEQSLVDAALRSVVHAV